MYVYVYIYVVLYLNCSIGFSYNTYNAHHTSTALYLLKTVIIIAMLFVLVSYMQYLYYVAVRKMLIEQLILRIFVILPIIALTVLVLLIRLTNVIPHITIAIVVLLSAPSNAYSIISMLGAHLINMSCFF